MYSGWHLTISILSCVSIQPNTNWLIGPLFGTEANIRYSPSSYYEFSDIQLQKMSWPWNPSQWSLKDIGTDTDRSATYDLLLTFHSNHEPILYRFRDKGRFKTKIAKWVMCMLATTWPVHGGCKIITYLESQTPSFLLTVQFSSGYNDG